MKLRYKIILLGVANAFWILVLLPVFLNPFWHGAQYNKDLLFVQPPEETMQKLEANGIARDEVNQLMRFLNVTYPTTLQLSNDLYDCDDHFKTGNMSRSQYRACSAFVVSYTQHLLQVAKEKAQMDSRINSSIGVIH
jgi:hypothetical protein